MVYGSRIGPSADSSIDAPCMNAPAAMMTGQSYPGMGHGSGVTNESTGAPDCMPRQKRSIASGLPKCTICMMSERFSSTDGELGMPSSSIIPAQKTAVLSACATVCGAMKSP